MPCVVTAVEWEDDVRILCLVTAHERGRSQTLREKARKARCRAALLRSCHLSGPAMQRATASSPHENPAALRQQSRQLRLASQRLRERASAIRGGSALIRERHQDLDGPFLLLL